MIIIRVCDNISLENTDFWLQISYGAEYDAQNNEDSVLILSNKSHYSEKMSIESNINNNQVI